MTLDGRKTDREPDADIYMAFNAWRDPLTFTIPAPPQGGGWKRVIDTAMASPLDIVPEYIAPKIPPETAYSVAPHSVIVLVSY